MDYLVKDKLIINEPSVIINGTLACVSELNCHGYYPPVNGSVRQEYFKSNSSVIICSKGCGQIFKSVGSLNSHLRYPCGARPKFMCRICQRSYSRKDNLKTHMIIKHGVFLEPVVLNYG